VGDLALLGKPILGHITAIKSGHKGNVEFAKLLRKEFKDQF
jgi:UDP-3-O-[3-hydroxymyristoyl] N-acetylglucosamine deacetylase/3-hydroxyacyl-[acyl-carrier-protein] dehydratase